jgi:hypothetical protein
MAYASPLQEGGRIVVAKARLKEWGVKKKIRFVI